MSKANHIIVNDAKTVGYINAIKDKIVLTGNIVKLSNTAKLGVKSWSLQAYNTCPASIKKDGELVDACKGCYATFGNYRFSNVKATREYNIQTWSDDNFVGDFVRVLDTERYFRWFDSGDMYSIALAKKMYEIMKNTPHVLHWLPTRMYKFSKFHAIIKQMQDLPNVVVRLSSDSIQGELLDSTVTDTNSTIVPSDMLDAYTGFICPASEQNGKCLDCKACYNKDVKTVAYVAHGVKMKGALKRLKVVNV
jgi:hypothetical protein